MSNIAADADDNDDDDDDDDDDDSLHNDVNITLTCSH